jgi:protein-S-isoprenylcysteine O-methyltransferase Ste14
MMRNDSTAFSSSNDPAPGVPGQTAGVIAPPPLVYAVPLVCGLLVQYWYPIPVVAHRVAVPLGIVSVLLGLVGLPAIRAFRRAKTSPRPWRPSTALVTTGPYRFTRNPMYVGFTLLYAGVAIWVNAIWPLLFLPLVLVVMQVGVIAREEAYLERVFGDAYREYRRRVRRWL